MTNLAEFQFLCIRLLKNLRRTTSLYRLQFFLNHAPYDLRFVSYSASQKFTRVTSLIRRIAILYLVAIVFAAWGFAMGRFEVFPFRLINPFYDELTKFVRAYADENAIQFVSNRVCSTSSFDSR